MEGEKARPAALTKFESILESVAAGIVIIMVANISVGVFFRYVLRDSLFWTEELGRYLMIWAGYLGTVLAMREDGHVGITAIVGLLPPGGRRVAVFLSRLVVLMFLMVVVITSIGHMKTLKIQTSSALQIPMIIPYFSVTFGALLMAMEVFFLLAGYPAVRAPDDAARLGGRDGVPV
ncbi:MAG TPA: TRAP transporter small permease [Magnetospirillaceae bacterium]|nr:TRAP transporter small permease [Magnetospirillaceae bacterium]